MAFVLARGARRRSLAALPRRCKSGATDLARSAAWRYFTASATPPLNWRVLPSKERPTAQTGLPAARYGAAYFRRWICDIASFGGLSTFSSNSGAPLPLPVPVGVHDGEPLEEVAPPLEHGLQRGDHQRLPSPLACTVEQQCFSVPLRFDRHGVERGHLRIPEVVVVGRLRSGTERFRRDGGAAHEEYARFPAVFLLHAGALCVDDVGLDTDETRLIHFRADDERGVGRRQRGRSWRHRP